MRPYKFETEKEKQNQRKTVKLTGRELYGELKMPTHSVRVSKRDRKRKQQRQCKRETERLYILRG